MKRYQQVLYVLLIDLFFLFGCAHLKQDSLLAHALRDRLDDYHQSATLEPLKVPEGTTAYPLEDTMPVPK